MRSLSMVSQDKGKRAGEQMHNRRGDCNLISLKSKPFYLKDEDISWIENKIGTMTLDEKIGQLFVDHNNGDLDEKFIRNRTALTHCGGLRYMNLSPEEILEQNNLYQKHSRIPLLVAANIEAGGNGACKGGTLVGSEIKVAATADLEYAYQLGYIGGKEAKAVGCNMAFTPIVDISSNWHNPIISTRTWSDHTQTVLDCSRACLRGLKDAGILSTAKHFPGDGVDERDHHYSATVNTLSCEEWDNSFGRIYKAMIDDGADAIMAGHIMLPAYQKKINPNTKSEDYLPASLCRELLTNLLRERLGFNGLIITDASHMVGMTGRMSRKKLLATALNAGCDMILFFNDVEEDFMYIKESISDGTLTIERIDNALRRILALKAKLKLNAGSRETTREGLCTVGCDKHLQIAKAISEKAVTLAKNLQPEVFPVTPERYRHILIMPVNTPTPEFAKLTGAPSGAENIAVTLRNKLNTLGFEAEIFVSPLKSENKVNAYEYKSKIEEFKSKYNLVLTIANCGSFGVTQRLSWDTPKGGFEVPWYVHEVPVIFISFSSPFHLPDVSQVKTLINCYDSEESTVSAVVDRLTGKADFTGKSPVDVFCGLPDTRI